MSIEEKAKAYDEALEKARMYRDNAKAVEEYAAVARYENIFPQLRESKDEQLYKRIEQLIRLNTSGAEKTHLLAYLEKQKEQKPNQSEEEREYVKTLKGLVFDFIRDSGGAISDVTYYQRICDWLDEKHIEQKPTDDKAFEEWIDDWYQGSKEAGGDVVMSEAEFKNWSRGIRNMYQQKPVEWSEAKELVFKDICNHLEVEGYGGWVLLLNALRNGEFQPKPAWGEEDEMYLSQAIETLEHENYSILAEKLKSLRPQPKQEWSEEDENVIETLIKELRLNAQFESAVRKLGLDYVQTLTVLDKCKRLYPSPSWKPSKEQMEALWDAYKGGKEQEPLRELIEQLKKL